MIYRPKNRKSTFGLKFVITLFVILVALRFFGVNFTDGMLKNAFNYVIESKSSVLAPARGALVYFQSKKELAEKNETLKKQNTDLLIDALTTTAVTQEFETFRSQFGQIAGETQPIKVILKPPFLPFDMIRISGSLEAYAEGSQVFYKNVVIGTLVEKTGRYGSVKLFSSPNEITPAVVKGVQFEAKGLGGGRYFLEAPKDFDVAENDPILYPNEQVILLGVVGQIESSEEDLFKKVYFNLPVPIESISYVSIGTQLIQPIQASQETQPQDDEESDTDVTNPENTQDEQPEAAQ